MMTQNWTWGKRLPAGNSGGSIVRRPRVEVIDAEFTETSNPQVNAAQQGSRSRKERIILIGVIVGLILFIGYNYFTGPTPEVAVIDDKEEVVEEESEKEVEEKAEEKPLVKVATEGVNSYGLLEAEVITPGEGSLHWECDQGQIKSDSISWEQPMSGNIELSPTTDPSGLRPVLITPQGEEKGSPIP